MRIKGFENIFYLTEFRVEKSCNAHSVCTFSASIDAEDENSILGISGKEIQVFWDGEEKAACIFCGRVEEVRLRRMLHSALVEVRAESFSAAEDEAVHTRIWQNPRKKLGEVLAISQLALISCDLRLSKLLMAQTYAAPILQNQEPNFAFLRRMAAYLEMPLWVEDTKPGKGGIVLAESLSDAVHTIAMDDVIRYTASKNKRGRKSLALTLKKYLPFGSKVKIAKEMQEYVICGLQVDLQHEVYEFSYALEPYMEWKYTAPPTAHLEKTIYFEGTVENTKDAKHMGRIQVAFKKGDVKDMDREKMWLPYQSPYTGLAGGIVFLPDVGDKVQVVFSNEGVYATAALRENALADECRKVEEKYIGNNSKRRIFFQEKALKIASGDHTLLMDDDKIELAIGESKMTMTKEAIRLCQGKTEWILDAKGIYIKADGNEMAWNEQGIIGRSEKDIGLETKSAVNIAGKGEIRIDAKGKLSLNGSMVNIG